MSRPADEVESFFFPDGAAFFYNIINKLEDARPIAIVYARPFCRTFPPNQSLYQALRR